MTFEDFKLASPLLNALRDMGFTTPTPIQQSAFSVIKSGRDVVGTAQTGTGKTYAYLLPLLSLLKYSDQKTPRVLILAPTRELVLQLVTEIQKLSKYMTLRVEGVYGGTNINTQKALISEGVDVLVATPGRLIDLALTRVLSLKQVRHLVIDEVDEMFSLGFRTQLVTIFDLLPPKRQHLLFSATMTEEVNALISEFLNAPAWIEPVRAGTPLARIRQSAFFVPNFYTKINLLTYLLKQDDSMSKVLIFGPSKRMADVIYEQLEQDFPDQFEVVHANKSQNFRKNAVVAFEQGERRGLIATDLLARGLDVTDVTHVINIDVPEDPETYIHRIGRTGRADRDGDAILMYCGYEEEQVEAIETLMEQQIPQLDMPEEVEISTKLTEEERFSAGNKNYLPEQPLRSGAFHEKQAKNKKVNLGNKKKYLRDMKYKKPKTRGAKKR